MTDKLLLNVFQRLKISTNARESMSVYKAKQVAIRYAKLKVKEFADNNESTYEKSKYKDAFKSGFSIGYKKGYSHRSDKAYTKAMFNMWLKYVAEKEDKCACFNAHARKNNKVKIVDVDFQGKSDCIFTPD